MPLKGLLTAVAVICLGAAGAAAQSNEGPVKIGVLNDRSSLYADLSGQGSVEAAKLAVEDLVPLGRASILTGRSHLGRASVFRRSGRHFA